MEVIVGPVVTILGGFVFDRAGVVVASFLVLSIGLAVVSVVVVVGTLVVVVTKLYLGFEKVISLLVVVDGKDMNVSGISSVEVGPVVSAFGGFVLDRVTKVASLLVLVDGTDMAVL